MTPLYLRHVTYRDQYRVACDEDTNYYVFDDACEPVGLLAERKQDWEQISAQEFEQRPRPAASPLTDLTSDLFNRMLLDRVTR